MTELQKDLWNDQSLVYGPIEDYLGPLVDITEDDKEMTLPVMKFFKIGGEDLSRPAGTVISIYDPMSFKHSLYVFKHYHEEGKLDFGHLSARQILFERYLNGPYSGKEHWSEIGVFDIPRESILYCLNANMYGPVNHVQHFFNLFRYTIGDELSDPVWRDIYPELLTESEARARLASWFGSSSRLNVAQY